MTSSVFTSLTDGDPESSSAVITLFSETLCDCRHINHNSTDVVALGTVDVTREPEKLGNLHIKL